MNHLLNSQIRRLRALQYEVLAIRCDQIAVKTMQDHVQFMLDAFDTGIVLDYMNTPQGFKKIHPKDVFSWRAPAKLL